MNKQQKPLVIVTGPNKTLCFGWWCTRFMLWLSGLRAVNVTPKQKRIPDNVRGVIIGGGDDIEPEHYGMTGDAGAYYDRERDALEILVVKHALNYKVPILGICRGSQLINIVMGGNLVTDLRPLRQKTPNRNTLFPIKWVDILSESRLNDTVKDASIKINSLHNQAVDRVGKGLKAVAYDRDNFIQATEGEADQFILGVQWHPEYMPYSRNQRLIFKALARAIANSTNTLTIMDADEYSTNQQQ